MRSSFGDIGFHTFWMREKIRGFLGGGYAFLMMIYIASKSRVINNRAYHPQPKTMVVDVTSVI